MEVNNSFFYYNDYRSYIFTVTKILENRILF